MFDSNIPLLYLTLLKTNIIRCGEPIVSVGKWWLWTILMIINHAFPIIFPRDCHFPIIFPSFSQEIVIFPSFSHHFPRRLSFSHHFPIIFPGDCHFPIISPSFSQEIVIFPSFSHHFVIHKNPSFHQQVWCLEVLATPWPSSTNCRPSRRRPRCEMGMGQNLIYIYIYY